MYPNNFIVPFRGRAIVDLSTVGSQTVSVGTMIWRLLPETFDQRATFACFSCPRAPVYSSAVLEWPFLSLLRPPAGSSASTCRSFARSQHERSPAKMASALVGLRYFVLGRFSSGGGDAAHPESNITHAHPGFFIVCNTILCSVGVWNLSLVQNRPFYNGSFFSRLARVQLLMINDRAASTPSPDHSNTRYTAQISAYMIFLGAFGLLCIFPM